jgi:hypothetical protein
MVYQSWREREVSDSERRIKNSCEKGKLSNLNKKALLERKRRSEREGEGVKRAVP